MIGLYAGRFQPFHKGHLGAIEYLMSKCDSVYVLICSKKGDDPWDDRNPFTFEERKEMIEKSLGDKLGIYIPRIHFRHICDQESDEEWTRVIEETMPDGDKVTFTNNPNTRKAFNSHGYKVEEIPIQAKGINATGIRKLIIRNEPWKEFVPQGTSVVIDQIQKGSYSQGNKGS